jgi:phosphatidylinositol glycan class B
MGVSTALDVLMTGKVYFSAWRFLQFNFIENLSHFFGSHPWHWYFTVGLPTALSFHLLPFIFALFQTFRKPHLPSEKWAILCSIFGYLLLHRLVLLPL